MCLIGLAIDPPGPWLLVVAANRDEFHDRRTAPAAYWHSGERGLLAGKDLQGGGTWLGLRRSPADDSIRIAALTNMQPGLVPEPTVQLASRPAVPPSRGQLVTGFLRTNTKPERFLRNLDPPAGAYAAFNLLAVTVHRPVARKGTGAATGTDAWYLNNLPATQPCRLGAGVHLVSNATLDVAWPKTTLLRVALTGALGSLRRESAPAPAATDVGQGAAGFPDAAGAHDAAGSHEAAGSHDPQRLCERLFDALDERTLTDDPDLPRTGLDHLLSAPFIVDDHYGTRCSTVVLVSRAGQVLFCERSFGPGGRRLGTVTERFNMG